MEVALEVVPLDRLATAWRLVEPTVLASGADGTFRGDDVGRSGVQLRVRDERWVATPWRIDTRGGGAEGLEIRVVEGRACAFRAGWDPGTMATGAILTPEGVLVARRDEWFGGHTWTELLPPGEFVILVVEHTGRRHRAVFSVGDGPVAIRLG